MKVFHHSDVSITLSSQFDGQNFNFKTFPTPLFHFTELLSCVALYRVSVLLHTYTEVFRRKALYIKLRKQFVEFMSIDTYWRTLIYLRFYILFRLELINPEFLEMQFHHIWLFPQEDIHVPHFEVFRCYSLIINHAKEVDAYHFQIENIVTFIEPSTRIVK